jgi:hypothetical protein
MLVLKLSMTFESSLLPTRHFLEANTTHSFYSVVEILNVSVHTVQSHAKFAEYTARHVRKSASNPARNRPNFFQFADRKQFLQTLS